MPFSAPHRTTLTLAPVADTTVRPITRGPYATLTNLNRYASANRGRLVELARANTKRLTGRDRY